MNRNGLNGLRKNVKLLELCLMLGATIALSACHGSNWTCAPKEPVVTPEPVVAPAPVVEAPPPPPGDAPPPVVLCSAQDIQVSHEVNSFDLSENSQADMKTLGSCLVENPAQRILIEGHADQTGRPAKNMVLSRKRADAVRDFMVAQGVDPMKIELKAWGSTKPVAPGRDRESLEINRRTIVTVTKE